jgi:hypothetical protein
MAVSSRPLQNSATDDAILQMKRSSDGTIFSREFEKAGNFAIEGTQLHTGGNHLRPAGRKSPTERHQTTDWLGCN